MPTRGTCPGAWATGACGMASARASIRRRLQRRGRMVWSFPQVQPEQPPAQWWTASRGGAGAYDPCGWECVRYAPRGGLRRPTSAAASAGDGAGVSAKRHSTAMVWLVTPPPCWPQDPRYRCAAPSARRVQAARRPCSVGGAHAWPALPWCSIVPHLKMHYNGFDYLGHLSRGLRIRPGHGEGKKRRGRVRQGRDYATLATCNKRPDTVGHPPNAKNRALSTY